MRRIEADAVVNSLMNDKLLGVVNSVPSIRYVVKLDDLLAERGLTIKKLAEITGLRNHTLSDFARGTSVSITKVHLMAIMVALRVTKITDIIDIEFSEEYINVAEFERDLWVNKGVVPQEFTSIVK